MINLFKILGIFAAVTAVLALLPALDLPSQITQSLGTVFGYAYRFNHIIDLDSIMIIIGLVLITETIILGWKAFKFVMFTFKS